MKRTKPSSPLFLLAFFSLLSGLCVGASASNGRHPSRRTAAPPADKISSDLRERVRGGRDERRGRGDGDKAEVIVQVGGSPSGQLKAFFNRNGVHVNAQFKNLASFAVELPVSAVEELSSFAEVSYVSADREVFSLGGQLSTLTGAESVRRQTTPTGTDYTLDGTGVGIAVLDSGIYSGHKSFAGRIASGKDYTGEGRTDDPHGHGTHVASIAAGGDGAIKGKYVGIAPNATLYNLRVLNSQGVGKVSGVLAALDDLLNLHARSNIRVVNMSLGMPAIDSYRDDPVCQAVRRLVDAGVVVVAAAGNNGKDSRGQKVYGLIHSPGNEPSALTVGASNDAGTIDRSDDTVASYSSRGPTRSFRTDEAGAKHYDHLIKPELVAPGNKIVAAQAPYNYLVRLNPALDAGVSKFDNQKMMQLSGTSMATPVAAGAAALLLQANPRLTPNMVKMILMYTAQPLAGFNQFEQGAGEINVEGAIRLARSIRTDLPAGTAVGSPLLTGGILPVPQTTISYPGSKGRTAVTAFAWSQGIILGRAYATGRELITAYQGIYGLGVLYSDGVLYTDGVLYSDGNMLSDGVVYGDQILTSNGVTISDGSPFLSTGVLYSDGVLYTDGVIYGDGTLLSDSALSADWLTRGDYTPQQLSILIHGERP